MKEKDFEEEFEIFFEDIIKGFKFSKKELTLYRLLAHTSYYKGGLTALDFEKTVGRDSQK